MPVDPLWQAKKNEWDRHLETHSIMLTGGAHKVICPLCKEDHPVCRFVAGALGCIVNGCGNPHHSGRDCRNVEDIPPF